MFCDRNAKGNWGNFKLDPLFCEHIKYFVSAFKFCKRNGQGTAGRFVSASNYFVSALKFCERNGIWNLFWTFFVSAHAIFCKRGKIQRNLESFSNIFCERARENRKGNCGAIIWRPSTRYTGLPQPLPLSTSTLPRPLGLVFVRLRLMTSHWRAMNL